MKRMLAFLGLVSCVAVGPAVAKDILVAPIPSGGVQYGSKGTTAAVFSSLLSDIVADMALKAARDHGPEAVRAVRKHGPALLKTMRHWTEAALNSGGRYAIQTWSSSKKLVPQVLTGGKDIGLNVLQASMGIALEGFSRFLKDSKPGIPRTIGTWRASSKSKPQRSPEKKIRSPHSVR
jgi:hypothetical protein